MGGIYTDLTREFASDQHKVHIVSQTKGRKQQPIKLIDKETYKIDRVISILLKWF